MAKLLFKLGGVPEDEAEEIRERLSAAEIDFYETSSGRFGLSFVAIWLHHDEDFERAAQLLNDYQQQRLASVRQQRLDREAAGETISYWQSFKNSPIRLTLAVMFAGALLYFSIKPFFNF